MDTSEQNSDYFISMTDMMVGVLFVFIIIVSYFVLELQKSIEEKDVIPKTLHQKIVQVKENKIVHLQEELERLKKNSWELYAVAANNKRIEIIEAISEVLRKEGVQFTSEPEIGVIRLAGDGLFNQGSSDLTAREGAVDRINKLSNALFANIHCYGLHKVNDQFKLPKNFERCNPDKVFIEAVYVEGHSDSDNFRGILKDGSRNNLELSARRATNTYAQMSGHTTALTSIVNPIGQQVLSTAAYGAQRPVVPNNSARHKALNRRIDLRFVMYLPKDEVAREALKRKVESLK
jgi:flagellar motor protein MotB